MPLITGTRLGSYEIVAPLGAGGMGEVYRAHDSKLGRDVAIKVLPEPVASDPERLGRFQREAHVLASLNHPNIAHVYGVEDSGRTPALVMELVEGPTLADRVALGPMPVEEAISIAKQITEALEAAHEQGIVHRDLKPANIKVRDDGTVKVLDFGLAKAAGPAEAAGSYDPRYGGAGLNRPDVTNSPTITSPALMTGVGVILGTAAYMSPEQAKGRPADKRSEIWAFGCVLYEMLTGRRAFDGDSMSETLAAIIKTDPDWGSLPEATPPAVRRLLRRSLEKDRQRRLADIVDARLDLQESSNEREAIPAQRSRSIGMMVGVALASVAVASGTTAFLLNARAAPAGVTERPVIRLDLGLPTGIELYPGSYGLAVSPDGSRVAFIGVSGGVRRIYLRRLDALDATVLPVSGAEAVNQIFFSPDGEALAFTSVSGGLLKTISIADGLVTLLADNVDFTSGGTWGADNRITFTRAGRLWQIPAAGGTATPLTTLDPSKNEASHRWPVSIGDGTRILFTVIIGADRPVAHIEALTLPSRERHVVASQAMSPRYTSDGYLLFVRNDAIVAAPFDVARLAVGDTQVRVNEDVAFDTNGVPFFATSASGALVYASRGTGTSHLVWTSGGGVEEPITPISARYTNPRLSPDGRKVLVARDGDLWFEDLDRKAFTRLTSNALAGNSFPVWTRDGRIIFRTVTGLTWVAADGSGRSQSIPSTSYLDYPNSVTPDNKTVAFIRSNGERAADVYTLSLDGDPRPRAIVATPAYDGGPQISSDGLWLLYASDKSGQFEVYARPFAGPDREWQVSTDGGTQARWSPNGKEVFYRSGNKMMAVAVTLDPAASTMMLSAPRVLFEQRYAFGVSVTTPNYDISLDGTRFLMVKEQSDSGQVHVVLNWQEELSRLLGER